MQIVSTIPSQNGTNVELLSTIKVLFDTDVDLSSIDSASITVGTTQPSILNIDNQVPQPGGAFESDNFLVEGYTAYVKGNVAIDPLNSKQLIFTANTPFRANTKYDVYVSQGIAGIDGLFLSGIYKFSFTTIDQDIATPIPEITPSSSIIGNTIQLSSSDISDPVLSVNLELISSSPADLSFHNTKNEFKFTFNDTISAVSLEEYITVEINDILSDYPPEEIDFVYEIEQDKIVITVQPSEVLDNKMIGVTFKKGLPGESKVLSKDTSIAFATKLTPYYSSVNLVRLRAGTVLTSQHNLSIALNIYYSSVEADNLFSGRTIVAERQTLLKKAFVLYNTIQNLLINNFEYTVSDSVRKQLGDFSIAVSTGTQVKLYNELIKEAADFKKKLHHLFNFYNKGSFSRGLSGEVGRLWYQGENPALNQQVLDPIVSKMRWLYDEFGG